MKSLGGGLKLHESYGGPLETKGRYKFVGMTGFKNRDNNNMVSPKKEFEKGDRTNTRRLKS